MAAATVYSDFGAQENTFGQKMEILVPLLGLQFILSSCTNDVFLPSFSMDEIALCDYFKPFGLFFLNKMPQTQCLRNNENLFLTFLKLEVWDQGACMVM